ESLGQLRSLAQAVAGGDESTIGLLLSFIPEKEMPKYIYQAIIGDGSFPGEGYYLALQENSLKRLIDRQLDGKKPMKLKLGDGVEPNTHLFVSPSAPHSAAAVRQYLEWQTHKPALTGNAEWLPLYRSGAIPPSSSSAADREAALRWYGYVP